MENEYIKEEKIKDFTDEERNRQLLINIIDTREKLKKAHCNFEFAEGDLVDYYSYEIKANQAKLNYLIRIAKNKGIELSKIDEIRNRIFKNKNIAG